MKEERCRLMHDLASSADGRVVSVRDVLVGRFGEHLYASSEGFLGWYDETWASCVVTVVPPTGRTRRCPGLRRGQASSDIDAGSAARGRREGRPYPGRKPAPTGVYDGA